MKSIRKTTIFIAPAMMVLLVLVLALQSEAQKGSEPQVIEATVTGENFCLGCALKKEKGAGSQCSVYGHKHSLRVTSAIVNGKDALEMKGWVLHYLETDNSHDLIDHHHGESLKISGKVYPVERTLEVSSFKPAAANETGYLPEGSWHHSYEEALSPKPENVERSFWPTPTPTGAAGARNWTGKPCPIPR